jgi:fermentation-respiration switch protein FrsA (DUF1100 family)
VFFVTGDKDEIVPTHMSDSLHDACSSIHKEMLKVPEGTHNDTYVKAGEQYGQRLLQFLEKCKELNKKIE